MTQPQPSAPQQPQPELRPQPSLLPPPFNTYAIIAILVALFALPPLGIYFGYLARRQIRETGERGIEMAQAAIIVGWVLTTIFATFLFIACVLGVIFPIFTTS